MKLKNIGGIVVLVLIALVLSSTAVVIAADYIVCPPDHEVNGGSSNNVYPCGYGTAWRYQQLYLSSELSGQSGTITNMYFRTDEYYGSQTQYTQTVALYNLEIWFGNTYMTSASSVFNSNIAQTLDWTLVYRAPSTVLSPVRQSGGRYWFPIGDVNDVFHLDATNGLLIELRFTGRSSSAWNLIMDADYDSGLTRIYSRSFSAFSGSNHRGYGLVTKFDIGGGIPAEVRMEPQSLNLESNGNWVNFKVENFPENPEYSPLDVDPSLCTVGGAGANLKFATFNNNRYIGKADRLLVEDAIGTPGNDVEVEITGQLNDGTGFLGLAVIKAV
jgi:hypothetical protein